MSTIFRHRYDHNFPLQVWPQFSATGMTTIFRRRYINHFQSQVRPQFSPEASSRFFAVRMATLTAEP
jgi:hypothetical protein